MRENELAARRKKAFRPRTTLAGESVAPNLIKDLEPSAPDQVWGSDITYISTLEGWLYLAVILDLFSRKVVGWKLGETLEAQLVVRALEWKADDAKVSQEVWFPWSMKARSIETNRWWASFWALDRSVIRT
jgi:hypothetical protein